MTTDTERADWDFPAPFVEALTVHADQIDALGHANNAAYVKWVEATGWHHSEALGMDMAAYHRLKRAMAIQKAEYDYLQPCYVDNRLLIATWLLHCDLRLRCERLFQIVRPADGATVFRGRWQLACIHLETGRPTRMPPEFQNAYGGAALYCGEQTPPPKR